MYYRGGPKEDVEHTQISRTPQHRPHPRQFVPQYLLPTSSYIHILKVSSFSAYHRHLPSFLPPGRSPCLHSRQLRETIHLLFPLLKPSKPGKWDLYPRQTGVPFSIPPLISAHPSPKTQRPNPVISFQCGYTVIVIPTGGSRDKSQNRKHAQKPLV